VVPLAKKPGFFVTDLNQDGLSDVSVWREEDLGGVALEPLILVNDGNGGLVDGTSSVFLGPVPKLYAPGFAVFEDFDGDELFVGQYVSENARINITRDSPEMTVLEPAP
jgi:hypothetical protein